MNDLAKYLTPPSMNGESEMAAKWSVCNKEFATSDLRLDIKDGLPKITRDELDDHPGNYPSLTNEDCCDLMSTIEVKDKRKRVAGNIKKISYTRAASLSNINESARIMRRKKSKDGVSSSHKTSRRAHERHHGEHRYCVLCKKSVMPERKYASHSTDDCTGVRTKLSIKYGMRGSIRSRTHAVQQHKKYEKNGRRN